MSVIFVIPRSREAAGGAFFRRRAALSAHGKGPSDLWSILPYIETGDGEPPPPHDPDPRRVHGQIRCTGRHTARTPKRIECTDLWTALWRATRPDPAQSRGKRHVIVFSSAEEGRIAGHGLISRSAEPDVFRYRRLLRPERPTAGVLQANPNAISHRRRGRDSANWCRSAYLNLLARYEIAYQPCGGSAPLKVRVQTPLGWGER